MFPKVSWIYELTGEIFAKHSNDKVFQETLADLAEFWIEVAC